MMGMKVLRPSVLGGLALVLAGAAVAWPQAEGPPQVSAGEHHAPALGITYQLVPYGQSQGAKLTRYPNAGSPAAQLRFEPGDMIISLDNMAINGPDDVINHVSRTTIVFINIRTNQAQSAVVDLPAQVIPPGAAPAGGGVSQPTLRRVAATMVAGHEVEFQPLRLEHRGNVIHWTLPQPEFDAPVSYPEYAQFQVEIIRATRSHPNQRAFWEPFLRRIEAQIAEALADPEAADPEGFWMAQPYGERIHAIYDEAMRANAALVGKVAREEPPVKEAPVFFVSLLTPNNQGLVYLMPRTRFRIRQLSSNNRAPALAEFDTYEPGREIPLSGRYVYKVIQRNGAEFPRGRFGSFLVSRNGPIRLQ